MLNIYNIDPANYVNGNGCRYVIWVQGCLFGCKECWNKQTWSTDPSNEIEFQDIYSDILRQEHIQGVTFTGGEPLLQAEQLLPLAEEIKTNTPLGLHIFTGYEPNEKKTSEQQHLLSYADTIVFGRFDTSKENNNQKVFNQGKYPWGFDNSSIEIELDEDAEIVITGYPTDKLLELIKESI